MTKKTQNKRSSRDLDEDSHHKNKHSNHQETHGKHSNHQDESHNKHQHGRGVEEFDGEVKTHYKSKKHHQGEPKELGERHASRRNQNKNKVKGRFAKHVRGDEEDDVITQEKKLLIESIETSNISHRELLQKLAIIAMKERDLKFEFEEKEKLEEEEDKLLFQEHNKESYWKEANYLDLRSLLWVSIDNDDSKDLDQLSVAIPEVDGRTRILVAIADVSHLINKSSAIDERAEFNTCSIYTPAIVFTMLPGSFCFDLTSLNPDVDRLACVVDMTFDKNTDGKVIDSKVYFAMVRNQVQLAYPSVGSWLAGKSDPPARIVDREDIKENLILQHKMSVALKKNRHDKGALHFDRNEGFVIWEGDSVKTIQPSERNPATELIENFMIAANGEVSHFLEGKGFPTIQRVVRDPERWEKIVEVAKKFKFELPESPNSKSLRAFLLSRQQADPITFPDLSLQVIKLMGRGEYVFTTLNEEHEGHFGLAVKDYTHTTAPNRRYPDLITQRLLKAALNSEKSPYDDEELGVLADHCTTQEANATKVERQLRKSVGVLLLKDRIGDLFEAIVTGATEKDVYARIFELPIEGKVVKNFSNLHIGDKITLELVSVDLLRSHIDFRNTSPKKTKNNNENEKKINKKKEEN